jgi:site-specific DNA recombinase
MDVDPGPLERLEPRRHAAGVHEVAALAQEHGLGLDDVVLDPPGDGDDLVDPAYSTVVDAQVDDEVDRARDGGDHEPGGDVLAREERQRAQLDQRLPSTVGVQRREPGQPRVECQQQVEALGGSDLADDDPRRPHPERLAHQVAQRHLAGPLQPGLPGLHRHPVGVSGLCAYAIHMTKTRAAVYVRISKDKTGAGLGVARQQKDCRVLADRLGWTVAGVYEDNDLSAYSGKPRPAYLRMLEDIRAGRIDAVLTWHTDRLHRSTTELERFIEVAKDIPTQTVKAGPIDLSTPSGRAVAKTLGAWAQYESEHKSERQKRKNLELAEAGMPMGGGRPFGYEADGMTVRDEEADVIRDVTQRVIVGDSLASIIRDLNERGIVSTRGNPWRYSNLRELVLRERNAGLSVYQGQVIGQATWPAIVSEEDLRAVQRILSDPSRRTTTGNKRKHLMSGLALCSECGAGLKPGAVKDRKGGRYAVYRCHVYRSIPKVDAYISGLTLMLLSDVRIRYALAKSADVDLSKLEAERDRINARLEDAAALYGDDKMTAAQFTTTTKKLRDRLAKVNDDLTAATGSTVFGDLLSESDLEAKWEALSIERKRAIIDALMIVTVHPVGRKGRGPQPIRKGVRIKFRQTGTNILGGPMPKDLERKIVAAFGEAA